MASLLNEEEDNKRFIEKYDLFFFEAIDSINILFASTMKSVIETGK